MGKKPSFHQQSSPGFYQAPYRYLLLSRVSNILKKNLFRFWVYQRMQCNCKCKSWIEYLFLPGTSTLFVSKDWRKTNVWCLSITNQANLKIQEQIYVRVVLLIIRKAKKLNDMIPLNKDSEMFQVLEGSGLGSEAC